MTTDASPTLAGRLRQLRQAAGMKQQALASRAGLTQPFVAMLERGRRGKRLPPATARRLAEALGVAVADLTG